MSNTWVLVANRSNARLFTSAGSRHSLTLVEDFFHDHGRHKEQDLNSDKAGRFNAGGGSRHGAGEAHSATEHEAENFARELSHRLSEGRNAHEFARLVLVAEPKFLGVLKAALDQQTAKLLTETLAKDFVHLPDTDIPALVLEHVRI